MSGWKDLGQAPPPSNADMAPVKPNTGPSHMSALLTRGGVFTTLFLPTLLIRVDDPPEGGTPPPLEESMGGRGFRQGWKSMGGRGFRQGWKSAKPLSHRSMSVAHVWKKRLERAQKRKVGKSWGKYLKSWGDVRTKQHQPDPHLLFMEGVQ